MSRRKQRALIVAFATGIAALAVSAGPAHAGSCSIQPSGSNLIITCNGQGSITVPAPQVTFNPINNSGGGGSNGDDGALFVSATSGDGGGNGTTISGTFGSGGTIYLPTFP